MHRSWDKFIAIMLEGAEVEKVYDPEWRPKHQWEERVTGRYHRIGMHCVKCGLRVQADYGAMVAAFSESSEENVRLARESVTSFGNPVSGKTSKLYTFLVKSATRMPYEGSEAVVIAEDALAARGLLSDKLQCDPGEFQDVTETGKAAAGMARGVLLSNEE